MADDEVEVTEAAPSDEFIPLSQSNYAWRPGVPIQQATFHVPRAGASVAELAAQALASERQLRERSRSRSPCPMAARGDAGVMPARSAQSPESRMAPLFLSPPPVSLRSKASAASSPYGPGPANPVSLAVAGAASSSVFAQAMNRPCATPLAGSVATVAPMTHPARQAAPPAASAAAYALACARSFLANDARGAEAAPATSPALSNEAIAEESATASDDEDAAMLAACLRLEDRFASVPSHMDTATQAVPSLSWSSTSLPQWAWEAHTARVVGRSAADRVLVELNAPALQWIRAMPLFMQTTFLSALPYMPCAWYDVSAAVQALAPGAVFLATMPVAEYQGQSLNESVRRIQW